MGVMSLIPSCLLEGCSRDVLVVLGLLFAGWLAFSGLVQLSRFLRLYVFSSAPRLLPMGQWAVVTGATDGIGKGYAEELCRAGLNVFIISRTQSKLDQCAAELAEKFPAREVRTLAVDFSGDASVYEPLREALRELDVGVLVNNVGMGYEYPMQLHELEYDQVERMVNVNILSMSLMTRIVVPGMVERRRGTVINLSSASALAPTPMLALYSGTKAFADFFTRAMELEYSGTGVHFQSVLPFFVATKMAKVRTSSLTIPSPAKFVRSAIRTIGASYRTQGYWVHSLQAFIFFRLLPSAVVNRFSLSMGKKMHASALRRMARNAKEKKAE